MSFGYVLRYVLYAIFECVEANLGNCRTSAPGSSPRYLNHANRDNETDGGVCE
jgi:hypothetical protein